MHEMSLCQAIADTVRQHAGERPVARIRLRIGHFRQVVPDTLHFCWKMLAESRGLGGAALDVDEVPATIRCAQCGASTTLEAPILVCGGCSSRDVTLETGEEFIVESIEIREEVR